MGRVGWLGFLIFQKAFLKGGFLLSHWIIPIPLHYTLVVQTCCLWDLPCNNVWWFSFVSDCKVLQDDFKISTNTEPYCSYSSEKDRPGPWLWGSFIWHFTTFVCTFTLVLIRKKLFQDGGKKRIQSHSKNLWIWFYYRSYWFAVRGTYLFIQRFRLHFIKHSGTELLMAAEGSLPLWI